MLPTTRNDYPVPCLHSGQAIPARPPVIPAQAGIQTPVNSSGTNTVTPGYTLYPGGLGDASPNATPTIPNQPIMHPRSI